MRTVAVAALLLVLLPAVDARGSILETPLPPTAVTVREAAEGIEIQWNAPAYDGGHALTHYTIWESSDLLTWTQAATAPGDALQQTLPDSDPTHYFRIQAVNPAGPSPPSHPATADTRCSPVVVGLVPPGYTLNWECVPDIIDPPVHLGILQT